MRRIFKNVARDLGAGDRMYRFAASYIDDHTPFAQRGVRTMLLIDQQWRIPRRSGNRQPRAAEDYDAWWHTPDDSMDRVSHEALEFTGNLVLGALPRIASLCRD